jgi:hypothetical protein
MTTPTTPSDDLEAAAKVAAEGPGPLTLLADREWQDLCEKDDRTSPADYPEMCLIARNELGGIISEGFLLAKDQGAAAHRALEAKVVELVAERLADKARIAELEGERDDLLDRVEELEGCQEVLSVEFEKDCWIAVRALLQRVGWTDFSEGVTADAACEIIGDAIRKTEARALSAEAAQARAEFLLAVMAGTFDGPHGWWETRRLWHSAVQDNFENAYVEQTVADEWRKRNGAAEAALRASQEALREALSIMQEADLVTVYRPGTYAHADLKHAIDSATLALVQVEGVEGHGASGAESARTGALPVLTENQKSNGEDR